MSYQDCEGLAQHELERLGLYGRINPWDVAAGYPDVDVVWGKPGERPSLENDGDGTYTIRLDPSERRERIGLALLHELAHVLLEIHGITNDDEHAWWLACALLLPRDEVLRARRRGASVDELVALHPNASHEAVGRRLVALGTSLILWVHDVEPALRRPYKVVSPGWRWAARRPCEIELEAMREAYESLSAVELVGGVRAWAVVDRPWVRVLCLSDGEVLLPEIAGPRAW
jgi:hypothetical protein